MTATIEGLAEWADERGLTCRTGFGHALLISEAVSVGFREARPLVVVEWGDGCRADFGRGVAIGPLTYLIAGLLDIAAGERPGTVTFDLSDPAARHALTQALEDYAARQRDMAEGGDIPETRLSWAAHAKSMLVTADRVR